MSKHTVYLSTGEIIEYTGSRNSFKRKVADFLYWDRQYETKPIRTWFRPCEAWQKASAAYMEDWKKRNATAFRLGGVLL